MVSLIHGIGFFILMMAGPGAILLTFGFLFGRVDPETFRGVLIVAIIGAGLYFPTKSEAEARYRDKRRAEAERLREKAEAERRFNAEAHRYAEDMRSGDMYR